MDGLYKLAFRCVTWLNKQIPLITKIVLRRKQGHSVPVHLVAIFTQQPQAPFAAFHVDDWATFAYQCPAAFQHITFHTFAVYFQKGALLDSQPV